jgi:hypothetical protein
MANADLTAGVLNVRANSGRSFGCTVHAAGAPIDITGWTWAAEIDGVAATVTVTNAVLGTLTVTPAAHTQECNTQKVRWWLKRNDVSPPFTLLSGDWVWVAP